MNETEKFKQFNSMYGLDKKELTHEQAITTAKLIADELQEFLQEFYPLATIDVIPTVGMVNGTPDLLAAFKELEDIRYITGQQATELGGDISAIGSEVHRSNMSKALDLYDSKVAYSELEHARKRYPNAKLEPHGNKFILKCTDSGKVIKPTTYTPAEITPDMID